MILDKLGARRGFFGRFPEGTPRQSVASPVFNCFFGGAKSLECAASVHVAGGLGEGGLPFFGR